MNGMDKADHHQDVSMLPVFNTSQLGKQKKAEERSLIRFAFEVNDKTINHQKTQDWHRLVNGKKSK